MKVGLNVTHTPHIIHPPPPLPPSIGKIQAAVMNTLRVARAALRARPTAALRVSAPLQRRTYADAAPDKVCVPPSVVPPVCDLFCDLLCDRVMTALARLLRSPSKVFKLTAFSL